MASPYGVRAVTFSVSVDNQAEVKAWIVGIQEAAREAEVVFDRLVEAIESRPFLHLSIRQADDE